MNHKDYYEILKVTREASFDMIKAAYRSLAFEYHPDRNPGNGMAVEKMKEINEAYAVLSDIEKRGQYDRLRQEYGPFAYDQFRQAHSDRDIFRGSDINQIFEEMARAFGFRGFDDIFRQTYGLGYQTFEFRRPGVTGKVIIFGADRRRAVEPEASQAPGLFSGVLVKLAGYAIRKMLGLAEAPKDANRYDLLPLDAKQAQDGGPVTYHDPIDSKAFVITIPAGVRHGQIMRLRGAGNENRPGGSSGDLYLKVEIKRSLFQKVKQFITS